jgi:hypothetical protein
LDLSFDTDDDDSNEIPPPVPLRRRNAVIIRSSLLSGPINDDQITSELMNIPMPNLRRQSGKIYSRSEFSPYHRLSHLQNQISDAALKPHACSNSLPIKKSRNLKIKKESLRKWKPKHGQKFSKLRLSKVE